MSMNFGPLNREGGERRLNVAITRARREMLLFTSFDPGMIDLSRTSSNAIRDLKHYIEFAAKGPKALAEAHQGSVGATESPFEDSVKLALERRGWTVRPQIGVSGFRIDLGIVHPERPGDYLAGIECDGAMYHSALTARDRDQVRQAVLEGLGWDIVRIWSTDFWVNAESAIEAVQVRLEKLLEADRVRTSEAGKKARDLSSSADLLSENSSTLTADEAETGDFEAPLFTDDDKPPADESGDGNAISPLMPRLPKYEADQDGHLTDGELLQRGFQPYSHTNFSSIVDRIDPDRFADAGYSPILAEMIKHAVETEAPIEKSALATVIARAHGFKRTGRAITDRVEKIGRRLFHYRQEDSGKIFVWREETQHGSLLICREPSDEDRKRPIEDIPNRERTSTARR